MDVEGLRGSWRGSIVCWLVGAGEAGYVGGWKPEVRWTTAYAAALQLVYLRGKSIRREETRNAQWLRAVIRGVRLDLGRRAYGTA